MDKRHVRIALAVVCSIIYPFGNNALSEPTLWKPLNKGVTTLLNEGWRIVTSNELQWEAAMDSQHVLSFILEKGGKYVRCEMVDPSPNKSLSNCMSLN